MNLILNFYNSHSSFIRFACVGSVGFCIDALSLVLIGLFLPYPIARLISFWIAASCNWWLNRRFTFAIKEDDSVVKKRSKRHQWIASLGVNCIAFIPNCVCYILLFEYSSWAAHMPIIAIIPGILVSMLLNFSLSKRWVFN